MKLIAQLFKKIYYMYSESIKLIHFFIIFISAFCYFFVFKKNPKDLNHLFVDILNGMGILSSFFILVIDKINIKEINKKLVKKIKISNGKREISTGYWISNTLFSLTTTTFVLLGMLYILLIFDIRNFLFLIWLISNIFIGFIFALICWSYVED